MMGRMFYLKHIKQNRRQLVMRKDFVSTWYSLPLPLNQSANHRP